MDHRDLEHALAGGHMPSQKHAFNYFLLSARSPVSAETE